MAGKKFKQAKDFRFHAWVSSTERNDLNRLCVVLNLTQQDVIRTGVKCLALDVFGELSKDLNVT